MFLHTNQEGINMKRMLALFIVLVFTIAYTQPCFAATGVTGHVSLGPETDSEEDETPIAKKGSKGEDVKEIQERLIELGYLQGKADGDFGKKTEEAVKAFQQNKGLELTGEVYQDDYDALFAPEPTATPEETKQDNSEKASDEDDFDAETTVDADKAAAEADAAAGVFDNSLFEDKVGYKYSKIEKKYRYEAVYEKLYSDGYLDWGLIAQGPRNTAEYLWMYVDKSRNGEPDTVTSMLILVDETLYTFNKLYIAQGYSTANFGKIGCEMVEDLSKAEEIVIRIIMDDSRYVELELDSDDVLEIKEWAKNIVDSRFMDYYIDETSKEYNDSYYEVSKE